MLNRRNMIAGSVASLALTTTGVVASTKTKRQILEDAGLLKVYDEGLSEKWPTPLPRVKRFNFAKTKVFNTTDRPVYFRIINMTFEKDDGSVKLIVLPFDEPVFEDGFLRIVDVIYDKFVNGDYA